MLPTTAPHSRAGMTTFLIIGDKLLPACPAAYKLGHHLKLNITLLRRIFDEL